MNIMKSFRTSAAMLTTAAVMLLSGCEKDESITPDDDNGNGANDKTVFIKEIGLQIYQTSYKIAENGDAVIGISRELYATVNPAEGESNANTNIKVNISIPCGRNIDIIANDIKNKIFPASMIRSTADIYVCTTRSDSILFDLEGYKNAHMRDISYSTQDGYINTIDHYNAEVRDGETYYTHFANKIHLIQQFYKEHAESFSMKIKNKGEIVKDITNEYISHSIKDPDGNINNDSIKAAKYEIYDFGYFDDEIIIEAEFKNAIADTTYSRLPPYRLEKYGIEAESSVNLLLRR